MSIRKLTILHSNDMHGDFFAEVRGAEGKLSGGLALLSGYINRVRQEEQHVLYVISGDMVQGNIIDTEYRGISTIEIMNYLAPDVVALGNHEFDYGVPHMLFLEKMANFPLINANMYIKPYNKRLMRPYYIIQKAGLRILFIGLITEKILHELLRDERIASFIGLNDAREEVGRITNAYQDADMDLTVLLTHIGFDADLELATSLKPEWGVDMIIGGHSHTVLSEPAIANGILIAQAGVGTEQVGRFDIQVDDTTNKVLDWQWKLVPIIEDIAEPDRDLQNYINSFKEVVDRKYKTIICKFGEKLTHPTRLEETTLGNLTADAIAEMIGVDLALAGSGTIRLKELGPLVTLDGFLACYPFEEALMQIMVTGSQLRRAFAHFMRPENRTGQGECYQVSRGTQAVYNEVERKLESLALRGQPVEDERVYSVCLSIFHLRNTQSFLNLTTEEVAQFARPKTVSTSARDVIEEYYRSNQNLVRKVEGRLLYRKASAPDPGRN
jgi:5'-nucleotidase / UDP-sugar diphosphatase